MRASAGAAGRLAGEYAAAAAAVAGLLVAVAACGSGLAPALRSNIPAASTPLSSTPLASTPAGTVAAPADSRAGAAGYARRLLAGLRLPAGARRLPWPAKPPASLSPAQPQIRSDTVDLTAIYRLGSPPGVVDGFLRSHRPRGPAMAAVSATGDSTQSGTVTSQFVTFTPVTPPAGIYTAELQTTFAAAPGGGTLLRVDSFVAWYPSRGAARRIAPAAYAAVTIRWQHGYTLTSRTLASRRSVRQFAGLYDALHGAPDALTSCPAEGAGPDANSYQLVFGPARAAPKIVVSPSGCLFVGVSVSGRPVTSLYPATSLLSAARRVMRQH